MTRTLSNALLSFALVAASTVPASAQGAGAPRILHEDAKLLASDGAVADRFGFSTALWEARLVVGAPSIVGSGTGTGSAYVFEPDEIGIWTETAKLLASDGAAGDFFGHSVAISGDRVVVGARLDDDLGDRSGSAYVFERYDTGTWTEVSRLLASDGARLDEFGYSVAISGATLVVGAHANDDLGNDSGSAYVFERDPTGTWTETAKLLASDGSQGDSFGLPVAISGDKLVVGAYGANDLGVLAGAAYVFERDDTGSWAEVAKLLASDGEGGDLFGLAVAISGDRLIVGAVVDDDLGEHSGSAYVFERDDTGTWAQAVKLLASDGGAEVHFGSSVAIATERVVVGANFDADLGEQAGSAYVFERDDTGTWAELAKLLPSDGETRDRFGDSVAIWGERLVVGATLQDERGMDSGAAYAFSLEDCVLNLGLSPDTVRAGEDLQVAIHLEHNRPHVVTVPFLVWIEAADGTLIARRATGPRTLRHGDIAEVTLSVALPVDLPAGRYRVLVGVEKMQQGRAWAAAPFQVIEPRSTATGVPSFDGR